MNLRATARYMPPMLRQLNKIHWNIMSWVFYLWWDRSAQKNTLDIILIEISTHNKKHFHILNYSGNNGSECVLLAFANIFNYNISYFVWITVDWCHFETMWMVFILWFSLWCFSFVCSHSQIWISTQTPGTIIRST